MAEVVKLTEIYRHGLEGYFTLADAPQRGSVEQSAFGVGWYELDEILKFYLGQFIVLTGLAGHGKSTLLLNIIIRLAQRQGVRSFLYVPENEGYLRAKLRKMWIGDDASFDYFAENQCFVQSSLPLSYDTRPRTLDWVLEKACVAVDRDNVEIVVIDPWNELERSKPKDMLLTDYIAECLMMLKQFCRSRDVIAVIVAHPTKAVNENGGRTPRLADIEGSMAWFNKCDNGLVLVRDKDNCQLISAKVRELGAGRIGECHFTVDPKTGIFTPLTGAVSL